MAIHDGVSASQFVHLGNLSLSGTTPALSAWANLDGFAEVEILVIANTITDAGTASGFTVQLEASADTTDAAAADVTAAEVPDQSTVSLTVTSDSADNTVVGSLGYIGTKQYLGVTATGTAGTDADLSIVARVGSAGYQPVTKVGTAVSRT